MKITIRITSLTLCIFLAGCQIAQAPTEVPTLEPEPSLLDSSGDPAELFFSNPSLFEAGLIESERGVLDDWDDLTKYFIDIHISDDLTSVDGSMWLRYTNKETVPLGEVYFRLFPNIMAGGMDVTEVSVDGELNDPIFEFENSSMRVELDEPLTSGESVEMEMDFTVDIPIEMGGNYGLFGYFEDILALQEFYPLVPVFDDDGWKVEIHSPNGDVVYTDPSYYAVRVTTPADQVLVTSGTPIAQDTDGDQQRLMFTAGPARDVYIASSDRFEKVSGQFEGITVNSYAFNENKEGAEIVLENAITALEIFIDSFGPYPYAELDIVSTHMQALGMEYPGVIANSIAIYDVNGTFRDLPNLVFLDSTTAHEVAHQWFFNLIHNDQLDEPWLDEAMAQYATGLYYFDKYGTRGYEGYRESWLSRWDRVDRADIPIGLPAGSYEGPEYGAIVYGRGPLFIEKLAEEMGNEAFDAFLKEYYTVYKWGIPTGEGFKTLAEKHCKCDLSPLFEEWVY